MGEDTKNIPAPWQVSDRLVPVSITGYLIPCHSDGQPVLARMGSHDTRYVLVFSSEEKLRSVCVGRVGYSKIVQIGDGAAFLAGLAESPGASNLRVAIDARVTDNGTYRFTQLSVGPGRDPDRKPV